MEASQRVSQVPAINSVDCANTTCDTTVAEYLGDGWYRFETSVFVDEDSNVYCYRHGYSDDDTHYAEGEYQLWTEGK